MHLARHLNILLYEDHVSEVCCTCSLSLTTLHVSAGPLDTRLALANTAYVNVSNNQLKGSMDAFAAALPSDSYIGAVLDVSTNQLSGPLPETLGMLAVFSSAEPSYPISRML